MRSVARAVVVSVGLSTVACSSTRLVQREGCWVKRTEGMFGSGEEMGFCTRQPQVRQEDDRLARLVKECLAQADHRWENQALAAWNRNQPIPPQMDDGAVIKTCMSQVSTALGLEAENGALKARLAELGQDREALRSTADSDRQFLQQNSDKMVTALGEAAKKPAPAATATATVKSETDMKGTSAPPTVVGFAPPAPTPVVVNAPPPQVLQAPAIEVPVRSSPICPAGKVRVKKLAADGKDVPACELPLKSPAG